jgi:transcription initiation factor TFIIIB Brf1 subunit/transcription initiation factor TFIIB
MSLNQTSSNVFYNPRDKQLICSVCGAIAKYDPFKVDTPWSAEANEATATAFWVSVHEKVHETRTIRRDPPETVKS